MIWLLLVLYQIKHLLADYFWQTEYMLKKFLPGKEFMLPLAAHCLVHSAFTFLITLGFTHKLVLSLYLAFLDFTIHFIMDRIKASPKMLGKYQALTKRDFIEQIDKMKLMYDSKESNTSEIIKAENSWEKRKLDNKKFWWSLGLDQGVHHLTHYLLIYLTLTNT